MVGKPQEAIQSLKKGLALVNIYLRSGSTGICVAPPLDSSGSHSIQLENLCATSNVPFLGNSSSQKYYLYDHAMTFRHISQECQQQEHVLACYAAVSMLNMSLACHQLGRRASCSRSPRDRVQAQSIFCKANSLYETVIQMAQASLQQERQTRKKEYNILDALRFICIAAQNNRLAIALEIRLPRDSASPLKKTLEQMLRFMSQHGSQHCLSADACQFLLESSLNCSLLQATNMLTTLMAPCA